jgi:DNA polymerase V
MINDGLFSGDIMIVDRSLSPKSKDIVIAVLDGEFTVKRILKKNNQIYLVPSNTKYQSVMITKDMDFQIWGVVTHAIHHFR